MSYDDVRLHRQISNRHAGRTLAKFPQEVPLYNIGQYWTVVCNAWQHQEILKNIYIIIIWNILTFLRVLLQLRKERAEITPWTILKKTANKKTRNNPGIIVNEVNCIFNRLSKSSIPYLARLLNTYNKKWLYMW